MVRAMAKEAEATREKTAAVIRAEGEHLAAQKLKETAMMLAGNPIALELRRLQMLEKISKEPGQHTVVVPLDFMSSNLGVSAATLSVANKNSK